MTGLWRWGVVGLFVVLLGGCSLAPSDDVLKQLGKSERSWCVSVSSVYGVVRMGGTGVQGGAMTCTQEGLSVTDTADKVKVPITVVPQVSIGAPTLGK
jgi:hypothetical protein